MQVSFIPGLARRGALRAQIETVRVSHDYRRKGLGASMVDWAIGESRRRGCALVQLTTDKSRSDAHRFYEPPRLRRLEREIQVDALMPVVDRKGRFSMRR